MAKKRTEPVKNTCPEIDRIKESILAIVKEMNSCTVESSTGDLISLIESWSSNLDSIGVGSRCDIESLREANAALREWGQEMYDEADSLEQEKEKLDEKVVSLEEEITTLEDEAGDLEDDIEELKKRLTS